MYDFKIKMRSVFKFMCMSLLLSFFSCSYFWHRKSTRIVYVHNTQACSKGSHMRVGQEFSKWPCNNLHVPNGG